MATTEIIVIVPRFVSTIGEFEGRVELFLPYEPAKYGDIMTWHPSEGHNEADWFYYAATRKPWREMVAAERMVEHYKAFLKRIDDGMHPYEVRVRQRLPNDWRERAWGTS
jgi:hypothetical protein